MINLFHKMRNEEHRVFEITMFSVSVCIALAVLITIVMVGIYFQKGRADKISDADADADSVTSGAVTVTEEPETVTGPAIISGNEEDFEDSEEVEELKNSDFGYTTATVNMRSEGSLTASVVTKVPAGSKVDFVELQSDNKWMKVNYK